MMGARGKRQEGNNSTMIVMNLGSVNEPWADQVAPRSTRKSTNACPSWLIVNVDMSLHGRPASRLLRRSAVVPVV